MPHSSALLNLIHRAWNTAVFWNWVFNGLRFASGILVIPILYRVLSAPDLDMYALFFVLTGFLYTFDHMFSVTIARNVGYAMRGITDLRSEGVAAVEHKDSGPNVPLLGQLLSATRRIYRFLSLGILVLLGTGGTWVLLRHFPETSSPTIARLAWLVTIVSACLELYTGYWLVFLRGANRMVLSARLSAFIQGTKLIILVSLLLGGGGLLAAPIAALVTGLLQRFLAKQYTLSILPADFIIDPSRDRELIRAIWPTSWRLGLILLGINVMLVCFGKLITWKWGLGAFYPYHFSYQILYGICIGMAGVWTFVKWPIVCQLRATNDHRGIQRIIWPRIWLQLLTYICLSAGFIAFGPPILKWIAPEKNLLPTHWLILLALYAFLEMHYIFWTTLISTENRIPSLWAAVSTNIASVIVAALLMQFTKLGIGSFIVGPLVCGLLFNFWFWPKFAAGTLRTHWLPFMIKRPAFSD